MIEAPLEFVESLSRWAQQTIGENALAWGAALVVLNGSAVVALVVAARRRQNADMFGGVHGD